MRSGRCLQARCSGGGLRYCHEFGASLGYSLDYGLRLHVFKNKVFMQLAVECLHKALGSSLSLSSVHNSNEQKSEVKPDLGV